MNSPVDCLLVRGCLAPGWPTKECFCRKAEAFCLYRETKENEAMVNLSRLEEIKDLRTVW